MSRTVESWGRWPRAEHQEVVPVFWTDQRIDFASLGRPCLPYGLGRSYGDSCLNADGILLATRGLDRFRSFDRATGLLCCEAGVSLDEILRLAVPAGWFLPVTPGTRFVTVGGAIANDVHGKNHHVAGTFGRHVTRFELLRSSGERLRCSPEEHADLFSATIGGLGLTGLITWAEFRLRPVAGPFLDTVSLKFRSLDEFFALSAEHDGNHEHTVSWIDCLSSVGRGIYMAGDFAPAGAKGRAPGRLPPMPCDAPGWALSPWTVRTFNTVYWGRQRRRVVERVQHYEPFFYPLDAVASWNRLYGKRGFLQYQFAVPAERDHAALRGVYRAIAQSGAGSFLSVIKRFGDLPSPGILSFPRPGVTLALDFPFTGEPLLDLLDRLDEQVAEAGGAVYPAKDARMSGRNFRRFFPRWEELARHVDPKFSSSFWRRMHAT